MTQITLSPGQIQQLNAGFTLVECLDPTGELIGYLHMANRNAPATIPEFSKEQLEAFEREPGGRSLDKILTDLRKRR